MHLFIGLNTSTGQYGNYERAVEVAENSEGTPELEGFLYNGVSFISYSKHEIEIVKKGIDAIREVLMGSDTQKKRSLLFALDWFMDPYYKQDHYIADIHDELIDLLQTVIVTSNDDEVSDDAIDLLSAYTWPPFEILENNMDKISEQMKPYVLGLINMDQE